MSIIAFKDVSFQYRAGNFNLSIPRLKISKGERVACVGPSGSGKTTLLNLTAGILVPQKGSVFIEGFELSNASDRQKRAYRISNIGFVYQDFGLIDYLNVLDNILHPFRITSALKITKTARKRAVQLADQMGIADKLSSYPSSISHGERQRTAICRALLTKPKLILADEATGNLDPHNKLHILELLFKAVDDHEATLLAVTHDQELLQHFDRIINFKDFLG